MKIKKVRLRNFRLHSDSTLDAGDAKFIVVRGKNFAGKTSLAEGISLALTPTTFGLDNRGAGFSKKIKRGESKAILEVDLQGANRTIRRTVNLSVTSTGRTQSSEDIADPEWHPAKFDKLLDDRKTALNIAINTRAFQSMIYSGDEKAQKNLLAQLVLPARYEFAKETIADVESVLGEGTINFNGEPFAVIESAYKKLFAERQETNRKVKEFIVPDALPAPKGVNSESLKTQLAVLREERNKQSAARDAAAKRSNEEALKRDRANAKIETLESVLKASKESLRALEANILPNPSAVQEVADRKTQRGSLLVEQQRILGEQETAKREQEKLAQLGRLGSTCPTCDQDIDEALITKLAEDKVAIRKRLTEEYVKATQALGALGDVEEAIAKLERHKQALADKADLTAKIEEHAKALKEAKAESDKEASGLFDTTTFDTAISKTDKDIETILTQIQPVIAAEERDKEIATKKEQQKRLEDKAAKLDRLTKYFDKDGIKAKLIAEYIGSFENRMNLVLDAWGYKCYFSIEPYRLELIDAKGVSTPIIDVSGAEELFFCAAMQCAVSAVSGIGFVVIDRVDTLLPDIRTNLFKKLYAMLEDKHLEQVILLVADTSTVVPKLKDSAFFAIEDGCIHRLG